MSRIDTVCLPFLYNIVLVYSRMLMKGNKMARSVFLGVISIDLGCL